MQLLYSRAAPCPEFASLSLLLKGDISGDHVTCRMGEPLIIPSTVSTISHANCVKALKELHHYINSVYKASRSNKEAQADKMPGDLFSEDEKLLLTNELQVFRPLNAHGLGLHFRLVRDRSSISKFIPLIFNASKSMASATSGKAGKAIENEVTGIILCVGLSGLPSTLAMSALHYSLPQRMKDCLDILSSTGTEDSTASRALLATLLLTEDEDRLTNTMAEGANRTLLSEADELAADAKKAGKSPMNLLGRNRGEAASKETDINDPLLSNSADLARIMVERLAVLSVSENDTIFRKYEAKASAVEKGKGSTRRRKGARDADLDGFDYKGTKRASMKGGAAASSNVGHGVSSGLGSGFVSPTTTSSLSRTAKQVQLKQPKKDTSSRAKSKQSAPLLMASSKDNVGRSRRSSMDHATGGVTRRQQNRRASSNVNNDPSISSNWTFDSAGTMPGGTGFGDGDMSLSSGRAGSVASRASSRHTQGTRQGSANSGNFDPFAMGHGMEDMTTVTTASESTMSRAHSEMEYHIHPDDLHHDDEIASGSGRSNPSLGNDSGSGIHSNGGTPRVQVNVALNEDLTCFYKLSKMSSCSVEGVIQVQVKSTASQGVPFFLLVRDPSKHIQSLQENKKFVANAADRQDPSNADHKFTVSVPKADNYFPVMRYKCGNELRPVPIVRQLIVKSATIVKCIAPNTNHPFSFLHYVCLYVTKRVQTRVRLEDDHWRVALQISSNPHNEDNLTDLTIIMGVPPVVRGESLTTSPPGGVWNASKRSVIWCVSELGGGEKFQLQARFEVEPDEAGSTGDKPKFPVLVRCQCMYAQLSDVEVEVSDIPEVFAADVRMKLARRFRLSHRERP